MKTKLFGTALILGLCVASVMAQDRPPRPEGTDRYSETGKRPPRDGSGKGAQQYSIEQAISDRPSSARSPSAVLPSSQATSAPILSSRRARCATSSASSTCATSTRPQKGHNPMFLDRVAGNVLKTLTDDQRKLFADLAREQAAQFNELALKRFPLIKAFRRQFKGEIPAGSAGLSKDAVARYVGEIFAFDAELSYERAQVFGQDRRLVHAGAEGIPRQDEVRRLQHVARSGYGDSTSCPGGTDTFSTWPI